MTDLLEQAMATPTAIARPSPKGADIARLKTLPTIEQDAIAVIILEELEDEIR